MSVRRTRRNAAVVIGSGELASAVARALHRSGFPTVMCDDVDPACMRRGMAYTDAWYVGDAQLEETGALFCGSARSVGTVLAMGDVIVATSWSWAGIARLLDASVVVDARTWLHGSPPQLIERVPAHALALGAGSGYVPGRHVHRTIAPRFASNSPHGSARTWLADPMAEEPHRRIVVAPMAGRFATDRRIGEYVMAGEALGAIGRMLIYAPATGVLSGLTARGARIFAGTAVVEVDTRGQAALCSTIPVWCREAADEVVQAALEHEEPQIA